MTKHSTFLAAAAIFLSTAAFTTKTNAQVTVLDSGTCGANLTWILTSDSVLTIHGSGPMASNYRPFSPAPWDTLKSSFHTLKIQYGVTTIGDYAFYDCSNLTGNLVIPNSVTLIGSSAFSGCSGLTGLTIPKSVLGILLNAFRDCIGLKDLTIGMDGASTASIIIIISGQAFLNCTSLTSITWLATTPPIVGWAFGNVPTTIPIYVPCGSIVDYQNEIGGMGFTNFSTHCLPICKVMGLSNNSSLGSVGGGGDYFIGHQALLYAAPKASRTAFTSYAFTNWSDGDTNNPRTITVISDTTLTANFALIITDSILMKRIDTLKNDTMLLNGIIAGLKNDTIVLNSIIAGLKNDTIVLNNIIRGLKNDTIVLNNIIRGLKNDTIVLNNIIRNLKNDTIRLNGIIANLKNDTVFLNSVITNLITDTIVLNSIIANLQNDTSNCNQTLIALLKQIADLENDTIDLNVQIAILQALLAQCEEDRLNLQILLDSCLNGQNNIQPVGTNNHSLLRIYPNPIKSNGVLNIEGEFLQFGDKIEIYDMSGRLLSITYSTGREISINIGSLPSGTYLLRLAGKRGVRFVVNDENK